VSHDRDGELVDRGVQPRQARIVVREALPPVGIEACEHVVEPDRFAEIHVHLAEAFPQPRQSPQERDDALFLLRLAGELAQIGRGLDDALVPEVHGQKDDRPRGIAQVAAHGHGQHAGLRLQQAPGTAAAALDEVFDRMAARHDRREIAHEDHGVERVAAKRAADEERSAHPQEAPEHRHVEVDAGRDVRDRIAVPEDHVREQEVVHVAAMTGHVDDLVALRRLFQRLRVRKLDAVIEPVPHARHERFHETHEGVVVVRRDLLGESPGLQDPLAARQLLVADLLRHGRAHRAAAQYARQNRAAM
jgi:hypothetical protein